MNDRTISAAWLRVHASRLEAEGMSHGGDLGAQYAARSLAAAADASDARLPTLTMALAEVALLSLAGDIEEARRGVRALGSLGLTSAGQVLVARLQEQLAELDDVMAPRAS